MDGWLLLSMMMIVVDDDLFGSIVVFFKFSFSLIMMMMVAKLEFNEFVSLSLSLCLFVCVCYWVLRLVNRMANRERVLLFASPHSLSFCVFFLIHFFTQFIHCIYLFSHFGSFPQIYTQKVCFSIFWFILSENFINEIIQIMHLS